MVSRPAKETLQDTTDARIGKLEMMFECAARDMSACFQSTSLRRAAAREATAPHAFLGCSIVIIKLDPESMTQQDGD